MSGSDTVTTSEVLGGAIPEITDEQRGRVIRRVHRMWRNGDITASQAVEHYEQLGILDYPAGKPPRAKRDRSGRARKGNAA